MNTIDKAVDIPTIPKYVLKANKMTKRQWKQLKRKQLQEVIEAYNRYYYGCAFCPSGDINLVDLRIILSELKELHSLKNWGR